MRHSNYPPDWRKRRHQAFERDGFTCQHCDYQSPFDDNPTHKLHAHHKRKIADGGGHGLDNLQTLCEDCHIMVHSSTGPDQIPAPTMYECEYDGCDEVRGKWALHNGGYCTAQCEYRDKAERLMERLDKYKSFCSTCFHNFDPSYHEICPNCGNWALDQRHAYEDDYLDKVNLVAHVIHLVDDMEIRRSDVERGKAKNPPLQNAIN